ncbi:hypothetical protein TNCV_346521 [Trichonephila clavipes]|nr:hypothetical protein TNCV_346521 [Trichonephila clavipes]
MTSNRTLVFADKDRKYCERNIMNLNVIVIPSIELLDSHNEELTIDELIKIDEQERDTEELQSLDPIQQEDRKTVGNLTEGLSLIEKVANFRKLRLQ